ncbi:FG-GAP repeat domain-containing protein [Leptolyngbya sp. 7M]|uniref:FG-GAP repeat domain-containing protein n=1 Tax=Leptolyngbya sp. 7M TaxID=2812896 RepID=UPI001B8B35E4|nr:VCBS repeat-containing protein [Leptolyngbya sp. 7M]QYO63875.1 FG-GAP repeat protein [Leptolyngbya sp. 7M]
MSVSFDAANTFQVGITPYSVAVADVNGDGILDLISGGTVTPSGSVAQTGAVSVLLGSSSGRFNSSPIVSSGAGFGSATALAVGDFNNDNVLGGIGKDMSYYALEEYTIVKHVMLDITGEQKKAWHSVVFDA